MVMSFLTTTGFESEYWGSSQAWSGLKTPGLILMGLCVLGGGIATTAGGVKLLRVYVLYKHAISTIMPAQPVVLYDGEEAQSE